MHFEVVSTLARQSLLCALLAGGVVFATASVAAQTNATPDGGSDSNVRSASTRIDVSIKDRRLWVMSGNDTLRTASIAVARSGELKFGDRRWTFQTPTGRHVILNKRADPVWRPPDWHYAEAALENGWRMRPMPTSGVTLPDGRKVLMRDARAGVIFPGDSEFYPLPVHEHIVFDSTLYIPPLGSRNREIAGELGRYALDIGDGYLIHGTPDQNSVGGAVTHGCLRLLDEDIAWLYNNVPVGAVVTIR